MEILILSSVLSWASFIQWYFGVWTGLTVRNEMLGRHPHPECILADALALVFLRNVTFLIKPEKKNDDNNNTE